MPASANPRWRASILTALDGQQGRAFVYFTTISIVTCCPGGKLIPLSFCNLKTPTYSPLAMGAVKLYGDIDGFTWCNQFGQVYRLGGIPIGPLAAPSKNKFIILVPCAWTKILELSRSFSWIPRGLPHSHRVWSCRQHMPYCHSLPGWWRPAYSS